MNEQMFWQPKLQVSYAENGTIYLHQQGELGEYAHRITDKLIEWAEKTPDTVFLADRGDDGEWRELTYSQTLDKVEHIAQALLQMDLSEQRPVIILSGGDLEHGLLALACIHIGVPYSALSEAYSLVSTDYKKLDDIVKLLNPGLVFANDGEAFSEALLATIPTDVPIIVRKNPQNEQQGLFSKLLENIVNETVELAHGQVNRNTIAKFLFTSGSTGSPKAVINTNGMICANQAMIADCYRFMQNEPPIVLEWAPWNHTAAGNKTFFMVMFNGGTLYIDDGSPTPNGMDKTIRNLRDVSPTWYFNVPRGYEELVVALENDDELRDRFFSRVKLLMYAGASLAQHTWDSLEKLSVAATGNKVLIASGLGATETSPFAFMCTWQSEVPGNIGLPAKGIKIKLVPVGDKLEAHIKAPSVTPGYWKSPEVTAKAFDEEGYYNFGDALRFIDPLKPEFGLCFDGRTAENFKLRTGTWVSVGELRTRFIDHFGGLIRDVVITGLDEDYLGALVFPEMAVCRELVVGENELSDDEILANSGLRKTFASKLLNFAKQSTGSSTRVKRLLLMSEPLSILNGEITDKGGISQRAVLQHRADYVKQIYTDSNLIVKI